MIGIHGAWRPRGVVTDQELRQWTSAISSESRRVHEGAVLSEPRGIAEAPEVWAVVEGAIFGTPGGAQRALRAYLDFGERFAEQLLGEYAVAIWDGRDGKLVLARDHIGARSLFLWSRNGTHVFGSHIRSVLSFPGVPRRPDHEAVAAQLAGDHRYGRTRALFEGVVKVVPGTVAVINAGGRRDVTSWVPGRRERLRLSRPHDYAEALHDVVDQAVVDATATDLRVGAHVSGGLDSSSIAVLGHRALQRSGSGLTRAFSWSRPGASDDPADERHRVRAIARMIEVPVTFAQLSNDDIRRAEAHASALEGSQTLRPEMGALRQAQEAGIGILLSGWGGDELVSFNGRGQLPGFLLRGRWVRLSAEVTSSARNAGRGGPGLARAAVGQVWTRAVLPLLPDGLRFRGGSGSRVVERALRAQGVSWAEVHPLAPDHWRAGRARVPFTSAQRVQLWLLARGHLTARMETWAAAATPFGIQHRYPLLDRRVIDFVLSLPGDLWIHEGWGRWLFRSAMSGVVPRSIAWGDPKEEPALGLGQTPEPSLETTPRQSEWPEIETMLAAARRVRRAESIVLGGLRP